MTASEIQERKLTILRDTDWTQLPDSPLDEQTKIAWAEFRQEIRDINQFEDPLLIVWPSAPYPKLNT